MNKSDIIGQNKLLRSLDSYNLDTFPHSVLFLGEKGCGKHLISSYISENILKLPLFDITENISHELLEEIYAKSNPGIYLINIDNVTEKDQNAILKFVEEPLAHIFVILLSSSKSVLLPTVVNRCVIFEFENYTASNLKLFLANNQELDDDILQNILKTPGKVKICDSSKLTDIYNLCEKLLVKLSLATYSNALSVAQKINYKDDYDKYDFDIFMNTLTFLAYKKAVEVSDLKAYDKYAIISDLSKQLQDSRLNKEIFVEKLISNLWRISQ